MRLSSGDYYFSSITAQGTFTLEIDLSSGQPININVVGDAGFAQDAVLKVKGAGTGGTFTPISQAPNLAALINWTLGGKFEVGGGDNAAWTAIFGGTVYSAFNGSGDGVTIDQRVDWYGALHAFDTIHLADHSRFNYVSVPEPATLLLLLAGIPTVCSRRRAKVSHRLNRALMQPVWNPPQIAVGRLETIAEPVHPCPYFSSVWILALRIHACTRPLCLITKLGCGKHILLGFRLSSSISAGVADRYSRRCRKRSFAGASGSDITPDLFQNV